MVFFYYFLNNTSWWKTNSGTRGRVADDRFQRLKVHGFRYRVEASMRFLNKSWRWREEYNIKRKNRKGWSRSFVYEDEWNLTIMRCTLDQSFSLSILYFSTNMLSRIQMYFWAFKEALNKWRNPVGPLHHISPAYKAK